MDHLPSLQLPGMPGTRDYLHDASKVLGRLQLAFLEPQPHDWHYGLQVIEEGLMTQPLVIGDEPQQAYCVSLRGWTMELTAQSVDHGNAKKQFQLALSRARPWWGVSCI